MDKDRKKVAVNVAAHLKKVQLLNPTKSLAQQGAFHCEACSASFKSYDSLLDHQNSKVHLSNTGFKKDALTQASSISSVKAKLEVLKKAKELAALPKPSPEQAMEIRLKKAALAEEQERRERYEKKKLLKKRRKLQNNKTEPDETQ